MSAAETSPQSDVGENRTAPSTRSADPTHIVRAVASLQSGEDVESAFKLIYQTYFSPVRRFFAKRLGSADLSLDLTQETFLRVYRGVAGYRGDGPFGAWVFRIAWNILRRHTTTKSVSELERKSISLDDPEPKTASQALSGGAAGIGTADPDSADQAYAAALRGERLQILRRAIEELPDQRRKCIVLWAHHELTYDQIATVMRLSIGTVKAHLAQARQQLTERISSQDELR